jgi:hypothetical protein
METSQHPGTPYCHSFAVGGERSRVDIVTAGLIDAKLELVDERRKTQPEVVT